MMLLLGNTLATAATQQYPELVIEHHVESSIDQSKQPGLYYFPREPDSTFPLLVALHSWSGDYRQKAGIPLAEWCIKQKWAFAHPNFRGPNWSREGCGSDLAVQDVLDAVAHVRKHTRLDERRIYLLGSSGGGHMALLMAGRHPEIWAGISAWVPIFDLSAWYTECQMTGRRYAKHMLQVFGAPPHQSESTRNQYLYRSPRNWLHHGHSLPIDINAGIRDGHEGSVPVSHSLNAFNSLVPQTDQIPAETILELTGATQLPTSLVQDDLSDPHYGEKQPLFRKTSGSIRVTIFDGGHESIPQAALHWLSLQQQ